MPTPTTTLSALQLITPVLPTGASLLSIDSSVLPFIINADQNTTRVEVGVYNTLYATDTFSVVGGKNQFDLSVPLIQTTQQTNVQIVGRNYDPTFVWQPITSYALGQRYADPNGNVEAVVQVGTSGASQPTWSTLLPVTATNVTVLNNVLTVVVPNSFAVGQLVYLTGFQVATFLNGVIVTVTAPGVTQFSAALTAANYGPTNDVGSCEAATQDNGLIWANIGTIAVTPLIKFALLFVQSNLSITIAPPSGISALKDQTDCTLQWVTPDYPGFIGVRVQLSTDPAGINPPFTQFGDLITKVTSSTSTVITSSTATSVNVPTAEITSVALANNLLTILANNTFVTGTVAELSGLIQATFLNSETVTVLDASPTFFTASFTAENYGNAITATSVFGNILTVTCPNSYAIGDQVVLSGTDEGFLNGVVLSVTAATNHNFQAQFVVTSYTNSNDGGVASIADSGTAVSVISTSTNTTTNVSMLTNYSTVDIPFSIINQNTFYAVFSTVIQDPVTNVMYESVENGPLLAGYVNLKLAAPTDFPVLQRKEDIAGRLIAQINKMLPTLDLSPHSEIRDIFIDPFSIEVANMSVREWFARVSTSISAISQVDNASGNGISDPFQSSPYKQQIARAYGLSPQDTQNLINEQFDLLGETAGLTRLGSTQSTVVLTFYTYQQPQSSITIPEGATVSTVPDSNTIALTFITQGQGTIDITNLASFYNSQTGWWGVSVPAQCTQPGSIGNVGAGTIRQTVNNIPTGVNVTNTVGALFGTDQESNSAFAARITARLVTGIDSSSANGYLVAALSTPGIIGAQVVAAGDLEMLRDWDPTRQKHVFGTVDIYVRGTTLSQNNEFVPFTYENNGIYGSLPTYINLAFLGGSTFQIQNFNALAFLPYDAVELLVSRSGSQQVYLSLDRAQFNETAGYIIVNPADLAYVYAGSTVTKAKVAAPVGNNSALLATISSTPSSYTYQLFARLESPFTHVPDLQPVLQVYSVTGSATETGSIPSNDITLIHTSDFLLNGGSNNAGDIVQVSLVSSPVTETLNIPQLVNPTLIDIGMNQPLDANGNPLNVISVLSTNSQTLYEYGVDYSIVAVGPYHQYGIQPLTSSVAITGLSVTGDILTVIANNDFGVGAVISFSGITDATLGPILNGTNTFVIGTVTATQFTGTLITSNYTAATPDGLATGSAIQAGQSVLVTYNKFVLYERLTFIDQESQVLNGTLPTTLNNDGFVHNTWLPQSYTTGLMAFPNTQAGYDLILDGWDGSFGLDGGLDIPGSLAFDPSGLVGNAVPYASRYIKVTYFNGVSNIVMKENIDFTLTVDATSGAATLARLVTGHIPDGATVLVSYFITETFTVSTQYPTFVEMLANTIAQTKSAAADVLIKAEVANPVDITLTVTLLPNTSAETVDPVIRTVINIVLDNANTKLFQSELISQIQNVTGVQSVEIPLIKCAKADGSYDIGVVIPTGTSWTPLGSDPQFAAYFTATNTTPPANSWITTAPVLPDATIPSGGEPTAIVDVLYQGQVFQRATSVQNFLQNPVVVPHLAVAPGATFDTPGSFYIVGVNDQINSTTPLPASYTQKVILTIPADVPNPGNLPYFVTYQVFDETGANDIMVSSTEYLSPGTITLTYVTTTG